MLMTLSPWRELQSFWESCFLCEHWCSEMEKIILCIINFFLKLKTHYMTTIGTSEKCLCIFTVLKHFVLSEFLLQELASCEIKKITQKPFLVTPGKWQHLQVQFSWQSRPFWSSRSCRDRWRSMDWIR